MRLFLGSRSYDLTNRALVMGTAGPAGSIAGVVGDGADIVEVCRVRNLPAVGDAVICLAPPDGPALEAGLAAGVPMVRLVTGASSTAFAGCARAGATVVVGAAQTAAAEAAGVDPDRIVVEEGEAGGRYPVLVDVTRCDCPPAATAVAVVRGARIVRTADVRGARRVCDVLSAIMEEPE